MPFGKRDIQVSGHSKRLTVDFDRIYSELLEPALRKANCEPFRADSEVSAGDIRTDMFFELVTADFAVADISIPNPNVYYELGIRDAACPRGVFIVHGGWSAHPPFDVAADRSFKYNGSLFSVDGAAEADPKAFADAVSDLAAVFSRAIASDSHGTGSPLYSHLPGLVPVKWDGIETSRSRYFGALQHDWEERVRMALELHRPGHIITIAQDAPTRIHRTLILSQAARALIGLCQYSAAEDVLKEVLELTPDDTDSQLYLGIVQALRGDTQRAEHQMRNMLRQHETNSQAGAALGYVYRLLWYLQWKHDANPRQRAKESFELLRQAIRNFNDVQRRHTEQYFSGYNALLLMEIAAELFPGFQLPPPIVDCEELAIVVRYAATSAKQIAEETGDYDNLFWSAVALSGLEMLEGNKEAAVQGIQDACAVPFATLFYLRLLWERLELLKSLNFKTEMVDPMIATVEHAMESKISRAKWAKVVVFHGYPVDKPGSAAGRFPRSRVTAVENSIDEVLGEWKVREGDLAICTGSTEADVIFGEKCLARGAKVRLLILEPTPIQLAEDFSDRFAREWATRSSALVNHPATEVWYHREELGDPAEPAYAQGRHNRWVLNTARMEAENSTEETRVYGLVMSDGSVDVTNPEHPSFFISEIRSSNRYKGRALTINPGVAAASGNGG
jgi:tetratricopeptide (TPR) repeat protein